jgi:crotonobetainyl-CoA:carnitine CoA-transferase CaiB-like acyl-CoA transferase
VRRLAAQSDVLVENYKLGGLDRYGLDYGSIAAVNPRIVYCSISGYGRTSPIADRPGYDYVIQAEGGLMAITGAVDGEPMKVGVAVADLFTGMAAAQAILAALIAADRDGIGQHIDMALYDAQLSMLANVGSAGLVSGSEPKRFGNGHPAVVPYQMFHAADGDFVIAVGNDRQFAGFAALLGRDDLAADPLFSTNSARVGNRAALIDIVTPLLREKPAAHWLAGLRAAGVPCGEVRGVAAALAAPESVARGMVVEVAHPTAERVRLVASPLKLAGTPVVAPIAPPLLGEHGEEVLGGLLGLSEDEIAALRGAGAIG